MSHILIEIDVFGQFLHCIIIISGPFWTNAFFCF